MPTIGELFDIEGTVSVMPDEKMRMIWADVAIVASVREEIVALVGVEPAEGILEAHSDWLLSRLRTALVKSLPGWSVDDLSPRPTSQVAIRPPRVFFRVFLTAHMEVKDVSYLAIDAAKLCVELTNDISRAINSLKAEKAGESEGRLKSLYTTAEK